jgi:hypothetical protein
MIGEVGATRSVECTALAAVPATSTITSRTTAGVAPRFGQRHFIELLPAIKTPSLVLLRRPIFSVLEIFLYPMVEG